MTVEFDNPLILITDKKISNVKEIVPLLEKIAEKEELNKKRERRILISQRDVISSFNVIKKDIDKALKSWDDGKVESHEITQIEFILKHINDSIDKLQKYIISGIKDIGKK